MKQIRIMVISKRKMKGRILIVSVSIIGIYLLISLYFINHYLFRTEINGFSVSLKVHGSTTDIISDFIKSYELRLTERGGNLETITSNEIGMHSHKNSSITQIYQKQNPLLWFSSLFHNNNYYVKDLLDYDEALFMNKINHLNCISGVVNEPKNVSFLYNDGIYELVRESYGNKINTERFIKAVKQSILMGRNELDLNKKDCYENPRFTVSSVKTLQTKRQLEQYVSARITYQFGSETEQVDKATIHKWLSVDENLEVVIDKQAVTEYISALSAKYNTVGIAREFAASTGKIIKVQGGVYGWKIDQDAETQALLSNIQNSDIIVKEPVYSQKGFSREENDIGDTYVEINITRQHLWFYKEGKLIVQGAVVTGNPNRGNATVPGVHRINYKQKDAILSGPGYEAKVIYWMPFYGNIGLHDASWRYRFGGEIYLRNGTHGCVNAPLYLAKTVYENIEDGTPVIIYKE